MKFWQRKREGKLYKQWVKHAELPREAISRQEPAKDILVKQDMPVEREKKDRIYLFKVKILDMVKRILGLE